MINAVGIDVSKRKSTVTILRPGDDVVLDAVDIPHTRSSIDKLIALIGNLDGDIKVCMECTGRYYEPMASSLSSRNCSTYGISYDSMRGQFVGAKGGCNEHYPVI